MEQEPIESVASIVFGCFILALLSLALYFVMPDSQEKYELHADQIEGGQR